MMNPNEVLTMFQQFKQNPMAMLSKKFNLPQNLNDPQQIVQHLLNSGQIKQEQIDQAMQMRKQFFGK